MSNVLKMTKTMIIEKIKVRVENGKKMIETCRDNSNFRMAMKKLETEFKNWNSYNEKLLKNIFDDKDIIDPLVSLHNGFAFAVADPFYAGDPLLDEFNNYVEMVENESSYLLGVIEKLDLYTEGENASDLVPAGSEYEGLKMLRGIIEKAKAELIIVDPYFDSDALDILEFTAKDVSIKVILKSKQVNGRLRASLKAFSNQHNHVEVKLDETIHDRFILIDNDEVFIPGSSLNHFGKRTTNLIFIKETVIKNTIKKFIQDRWSQASPIIF